MAIVVAGAMLSALVVLLVVVRPSRLGSVDEVAAAVAVH
jgi:hypothetical protein